MTNEQLLTLATHLHDESVYHRDRAKLLVHSERDWIARMAAFHVTHSISVAINETLLKGLTNEGT